MSSLKALIFDFDGVIADTERLQLDAWRRVFSPHAVPSGIDWDALPGKADLEIARLLGARQPRRLVQRKQALEEVIIREEGLKAITGVRDFIRRAERRYRLAIASSCHPVVLHERLETLELSRHFSVVAGVVNEQPKPAPDVYLKALAGLGLPASACWAIEDSPAGLAAARAADIPVVALATTFPPSALEESSRAVFRSYEELTPRLQQPWSAYAPMS
jgi:HAD superfamily hydrolase (TIGR01509 family)